MPRYDQWCPACQWQDEILVAPGTMPPCPKCGGRTERLWQRSAAVVGDDIPGGQVIENLGHRPMTFYSKKEIVREAARRGLEPCVRHLPGDPHTTSWATIDAYTLEAARVLVSRGGIRSADDEDAVPGITGQEAQRLWEESRR